MSNLNSIAPPTFKALTSEVYRHTGIHLEDHKKVMLKSRLRRVAKGKGLATFEDLLVAIKKERSGSALVNAFIDAVTTNKTSFFRSPKVWSYLLEEYLPSRTGGSMRSWSAACSTGQEAASMAMVCEAHRERSNGPFRYEVFGSDVSASMVAAATNQTFARTLVDAIVAPPKVNARAYFDIGGSEATLKGGLRANLRFAQHNLLKPMSGRAFDIVFLRNVIIYFTPEDVRRVMDNAINALAPGGLLIAGGSESPLHHTDRLEFVGPCLYRRTT